jgi:uncharacterized protein with ATP-grasp and redox domains
MVKEYPPPIISDKPGSWANSTVVIRWPDTAREVLKDNEFPLSIKENITQLIEDIPNHPIRHLEDPQAPDWEIWSSFITPWEGKNWLKVPWFFGEHYFYRRIIEAVDYFNTGLDPFWKKKQLGLEKSQDDIKSLAVNLDQLQNNQKVEMLSGVFLSSLWGNQADLSLWPAGSSANPEQFSQLALKSYLLADDSQKLLNQIKKIKPSTGQLGLLLDNAGFELVTDLGLADTFLRCGFVSRVDLYVKAHPTFVSDVIEIDVHQAIEYLAKSSDQLTRALGIRLEDYIKEGRLKIQAHYFWNSPLAMWELPPDLYKELGKADLLISKGDANYRRLLGDLEWDFTLPFHQVVDYLPAPLAALRTLKAELVVGLNLEQIQETYNQDPNWLVDGKWGLIQYAPSQRA